MPNAMSALSAFTEVLRSVLLPGGVAMVVLAADDWAVRTRRINPFSGVARFMRAQVDPRLDGIERQVLRAGGHPSATPWWAVVAYVVIAALALAIVDVLFGLVREVFMATTLGREGLLALAVHWTFGFFSFALLARVMVRWFRGAAARL